MGRQIRIAGTERNDVNEEIENAAEAYVEIRDKRMELTKKEGDSKAVLAAAMKAAKLKIYRCDRMEMEVLIEPGEATLKVKQVKVEATEGDSEDAPD